MVDIVAVRDRAMGVHPDLDMLQDVAVAVDAWMIGGPQHNVAKVGGVAPAFPGMGAWSPIVGKMTFHAASHLAALQPPAIGALHSFTVCTALTFPAGSVAGTVFPATHPLAACRALADESSPKRLAIRANGFMVGAGNEGAAASTAVPFRMSPAHLTPPISGSMVDAPLSF